jgi:hypothetical protein
VLSFHSHVECLGAPSDGWFCSKAPKLRHDGFDPDQPRLVIVESLLREVSGLNNSNTTLSAIVRFFGRGQLAVQLAAALLTANVPRQQELIHDAAVHARNLLDQAEADAARGVRWKRPSDGCFSRSVVSLKSWYQTSAYRPTYVGLLPDHHVAIRLCRKYHSGWSALPSDLFRVLLTGYIIPAVALDVIESHLRQTPLSADEIASLSADAVNMAAIAARTEEVEWAPLELDPNNL